MSDFLLDLHAKLSYVADSLSLLSDIAFSHEATPKGLAPMLDILSEYTLEITTTIDQQRALKYEDASHE